MRSFRRAAVPAALSFLVLLGASLFAQAAPGPAAAALADPFGAAKPQAKVAVVTAQTMAAEGKWKQAFDVLASFDPANADPYVLAQKIQLCLKGYVQTDMHISFALVDLAAGETLEDLRAKGGRGTLLDFDPFTAVQKINEALPELPPVLHLALGDYCFDVQALYGDQWQATEEEVCSVGLSSYEEAQKGGLSTAQSLLRQGELLMRFDRNEEAELSLRASLVLDGKSLEARKNLAISLAQGGKVPEAIAVMDALVADTKDPSDRFGILMAAARIGAMGGLGKAEAYIKAAEKEFPTEPGPALVRHMIAVQSQTPADASLAADMAMDGFPDSPYVVRNILTTWLNAEDVPQAQAFLERNLVRQAKDSSQAILGFYKALLIAQTQGQEGFAEALKVLDLAEQKFKSSFPAGDQVFEAIDQLRGQLADPPPEAGAPTTP